MADCPRCSQPSSFDGLHLMVWAVEGHSSGKLKQKLVDHGVSFVAHTGSGALVVETPDHRNVAMILRDTLSHQELWECKTAADPSPEPSISTLRRVMPAAEYVGRVQGEWLVDLVESDRIFNVTQAIVDAGGSPLGHEFLIRGQESDGTIIPAPRILDAAGTPRMAAYFDRAARVLAVRTAGSFVPDGMLFINFLPSSIYDPAYCLRTTVDAIGTAGIDPARLVFEVVESDQITDLKHLRDIISYYRQAGFSTALDDFGTGFNNLETFLELESDFIKVDQKLVRAVAQNPIAKQLVKHICDLSHQAGAMVIAEGIEDPESLTRLRDLGADLFQGYLFGRPERPNAPS